MTRVPATRRLNGAIVPAHVGAPERLRQSAVDAQRAANVEPEFARTERRVARLCLAIVAVLLTICWIAHGVLKP